MNAALLAKTRPIEGWLSDSETLLLFYLAAYCGTQGHIVEIGSFKGKSTVALALGLKESGKGGFVWAVDPHEGEIRIGKKSNEQTYAEFLKTIHELNVEMVVRPILDTSARAAKRWKKSIRLLFIDGLHDYEHVQADIAYWSSWVVNNGVIAFHDAFCGQHDVWRAISTYIFHRSDIVDIGTASSILYVEFGQKTWQTTFRVFFKKRVVSLANHINTWAIPWFIKVIVIHRFCRLLLWSKYTDMIYRRK